jgi:hypothetical protein
MLPPDERREIGFFVGAAFLPRQEIVVPGDRYTAG